MCCGGDDIVVLSRGLESTSSGTLKSSSEVRTDINPSWKYMSPVTHTSKDL
jgi:hypothetical protein